MATQAALRARVRAELGEASAAIWTDARLDEFLDQTLQDYNQRWSVQAVSTPTVLANATSESVPTGAIDVLRVQLEDGTVLRQRIGVAAGTRGQDEHQAWEVFAGTIYFTQALEAQTLTIWYTSEHDYADLPERDEVLFVAGAVWRAVQGREIDDLRRQGVLQQQRHGFTERDAEEEYEALLRARGRRVRQT